LLIGGLIKHQETDSRAKIPFFSQIPFLGAFFRGKDSMDDDRELLIFLTPHIAEEGTVLAKREMRLRREQINPFRRRTIGITLDKFSQ
ncbi:MAG: type II and III secretion system protein, partial [Candidatus Omnitrophica bacterium]|nr:type II and III secretion system protein [Candidatus Omnitrophota bacterium]